MNDPIPDDPMPQDPIPDDPNPEDPPPDPPVPPTQVRHPWRSTLRTAIQFLIGAATLIPFITSGIYDTADQAPAVVVQVLAVIALVTRVMALPQVDAFLRKWKILQWLATAPPAPDA